MADPEKTHVDSSSDERVISSQTGRVLSEREKEHMRQIKDRGADFADYLTAHLPVGRETSIAKTRIEEAVMWAVKALTA